MQHILPEIGTVHNRGILVETEKTVGTDSWRAYVHCENRKLISWNTI